MKTIWLNRGQWPVYIGFCPDEKEWNKQMRRMNVSDCPYPEGDAHCAMFDTPEGKNCVIVTMCDKEVDDLMRLGLFCHEASHIVDHIFNVCGEDKPGGETRAYLMQYIFQELVDAYGRSGRVDRKV